MGVVRRYLTAGCSVVAFGAWRGGEALSDASR